jgi:hypothetical protein
MKDLALMIGHHPEVFQSRIRSFLMFCEDLQRLLDRENDILLEKGTVAFDSFFFRKINMLNDFEPEIKAVFTQVRSEAPDNRYLQTSLIETVQNIRRALCVNTSFHLTDLRRRTGRLQALRDGLSQFAGLEQEEGSLCH